MAAPETRFDRAYYERFYHSKGTRVQDREQVDRLADFVCSYLRYLELPVRRVLDLGCGIGLWRPAMERHFPRARYQGVEYSAYLCETYGWEQGSVVDYAAREPFDLIICQGVLPYLSAADVKRAAANLGRLCRGALYLEAVTREDWEGGVLDKRRTDRAMNFHPARLYRRALGASFQPIGGGLWLSERAQASLYELEKI
jgi:predicted TPR repeat methyltransferase